jgi:hypothetical protein
MIREIGQDGLGKTTVLRQNSCQPQKKIKQNQRLTDYASLSSVDCPEGGRILGAVNCRVPCDYVPRRSWPLFKARAVLAGLLASPDLESNP